MIDIRTLALATGAVALFISVPFIVLVLTKKAFPGVFQWAAGLICSFFGLSLLGLRNLLPDVLSIVVGGTLILAFLVLLVRGMNAFVGDRQRNWLDVGVIVGYAALMILFMWPWPDTAARIVVFSAAATLVMVRGFVIVWFGFPRVIPGRDVILLAVFALSALWLVIRAVLSLLFVRPAADFMSSGIYQGATFLAGIGAIIVCCTSLLIATIRRLARDLTATKSELETLSGLLPICSSCKKIRADDGSWVPVERYISTRSELSFSHGLCPDCMKKYYPEFSGKG